MYFSLVFLSLFSIFCFIHTGKSKESSQFDPNRQEPESKQKVFMDLSLKSAFKDILQNHIHGLMHRFLTFHLFSFTEKPQKTKAKCFGRQEHVLCTHNI